MSAGSCGNKSRVWATHGLLPNQVLLVPGIFIGHVVTPQRVLVLERSWNGFHSGTNYSASAVENVPLGEITPITLFLPERRIGAPSMHLPQHHSG